MATIQDDRTKEQKTTHYLAVLGTDSFLSGWGGAKGGASYAAWVVGPGSNINDVQCAVERRPDMKRVRVVDLRTYRPSRGCAHLHIYVWDDCKAGARTWGRN